MSLATLKAKKEKLEQDRAGVAAEMQKLRDAKADSEWTAEDRAAWDEFQAKADNFAHEIKRTEFDMSELPAGEHDGERFDDLADERDAGGDVDSDSGELTARQRDLVLRAYLRKGKGGPIAKDVVELAQRAGLDLNENAIELRIDRGFWEDGSEMGVPRSRREVQRQAEVRRKMSPKDRRALNRERSEVRAQSTTVGAEGLFTMPDEMMRAIDDARLHFGGMRAVANIITTQTGNDLPIPTGNDTGNEGEILGENTETAYQDLSFGQVVLEDVKFNSKMVKMSWEFLQDTSINATAYIGRKLGERIGRIENRMYTTGTGTAQPRGILTDAVNSTVTASVAGKVGWDELVDLEHSVDIAYRSGAQFMMADPTAAVVKKLKDGDGRPIWQPSMMVGEPDSILGYGYQINNDMPSGAASKGIIFGALNQYLIRDILSLQMQRLTERYAEFWQVAMLAMARGDGALIDAGTGPVKYMTLA